MITDIKKIKKISKEKLEKNFEFRSFLKMLEMDDEDLDEIVKEIAIEVSSQIDCKKCRNCCKGPAPTLSEEKIKHILNYLEISEQEFKNNYVNSDKTTPYEIVLHHPCPFFKKDECIIEKNKPKMCVDYPYLLKEGFRSRLLGVIDNYEICPIVFNVYEALKQQLWRNDFY